MSSPRLLWKLRYVHARRMASAWRRRTLLATHGGHLDLEVAKGVAIGPRVDFWIPAQATLHIGPACEFRRDFFCEIAPGGRVEMADRVVFTSAALLQISTSLTIGSRAVFGQSVMIADGNHLFRDHTKHLLDQGYDFRPIEIGDNAIVTSKCTILNSIGEGAIIGAGSVVTRPIPAYCLAYGAPARVVEYFGPADQRPEGLPKDV
ncbi:MAG TPA: acyltransferase [Mycobacteriales bacterium]|nr:acyltransferase [Mycobacteriales bacterium]